MTNRTIDCVIEGVLKDGDKIDFAKEKLAVHAFVKDQDLAHATVDPSGHYRLAFKYEDCPPATQLRVVPAEFSDSASETLALTEPFNPTRYAVEKDSAIAHRDLLIPSNYIELMENLRKFYDLHGEVWCATYQNGELLYIEPLPAVKIDFFLEPVAEKPVLPLPRPRRFHLGQAYSAPDGSYDFKFKLPPVKPYPIKTVLPPAAKLNIQARVSQLVGGVWKTIFVERFNWAFEPDVHKDFFVPAKDVIKVGDPGEKPLQGFRYTGLGLLPLDTTRIQQGYATSQTTDPVPGISHQPFCDTLRVFGLFAAAPPVATYQVQIADADENHATGTWEDINDPLVNLKWNDTDKRWDAQVLGPDPVTKLYQNIDTQPEADWMEHALKFTFNSANKPDGFYALQIVGYDVTGALVGTFEMPVVRVANTLPEISVAAVQPQPTECGILQLPDQKITFSLTAYDPEGHVLYCQLSGNRGTDAASAGATVVVNRPDPTTTWNGLLAQDENFAVDPLPSNLVNCPAVAYNFEFMVQGAGTNCYAATLESQRQWRQTNLVVMPTP